MSVEHKIRGFVIAAIMLLILAISILVVYIILNNLGWLQSDTVIQNNFIPCNKKDIEEGSIKTKYELILVRENQEDLCLPIRELSGFNNSIMLAESISLLGIFVTIIGVMLPLIAIFTIQHQRVIIENKLKEKLIKEFLTLKSSLLDNISKSEEGLKESIQCLINTLPQNIVEIVKFRQFYIADKLRQQSAQERGEVATSNNTQKYEENSKPIHTICETLTDASQLESALLSIYYAEDQEIIKAFDMVADFINPIDVQLNELHISELKNVLGRFYSAGIFNSDIKREALNRFLKDTLHTAPSQWLNKFER